MRYVVTVLTTSTKELWPRYHDFTAKQLSASSNPDLFARFAWAIFARANVWVGVGDQRAVLRQRQNPATKRLSYEKVKSLLPAFARDFIAPGTGERGKGKENNL